MINKKDITKLEGLLYLYAVSKVGSKREVADKLGTSGDTVNKYITDLEAELKTRFLVSNGRGTVITPEGQRILRIADVIVKALHSLGDYGENAASFKGIVRLAMPDAISIYLGTDKLSEFCSQYPDINFEVSVQNVLPNMNALEADIALSYDEPNQSDLVSICTKRVKCGLFASRKYIETHGVPKDLTEMVKKHRICDKINHRDYVPGWRNMMEEAAHLVYSTNSIFALRSSLEEGMGIGMFPLAFNGGNLIHILKEEFSFEIPVYLMAHRETKDTPRIRIVLDTIRKILDEKDNLLTMK